MSFLNTDASSQTSDRTGQRASTTTSRHSHEWLIEAGQPDDLGLYLKAAQHTIPKKNMLAFWDAFGEIFGMPLRMAKTSTRDEKERKRINEQLAALGFAGSAVLPLDTELEFVESSRGDAYNVYNERVDRANSELSKLIIGQTMTIEDGSSLSQSQTHLQVFQNLIDADADMLRDVVNNQLLPRKWYDTDSPSRGCASTGTTPSTIRPSSRWHTRP
jgi:hypothetical protein